jgi:hypothetical protein
LAIARGFSHVPTLAVWAILISDAAMVLTGWLILEQSHHKVIAAQEDRDERTVEEVAGRLAKALREGEVTSIR